MALSLTEEREFILVRYSEELCPAPAMSPWTAYTSSRQASRKVTSSGGPVYGVESSNREGVRDL